jgi:hypothetical protein
MPVIEAHAQTSDGIMTSQAGYIDRGSGAVNLAQELPYIICSASTVAGDNSGNTIIDVIVCGWPFKNAALDMSVYIYKTRSHNPIARVNRLNPWIPRSQTLPHGYNPVATDGNISFKPAVAGTIYNPAIGNNLVWLLRFC